MQNKANQLNITKKDYIYINNAKTNYSCYNNDINFELQKEKLKNELLNWKDEY